MNNVWDFYQRSNSVLANFSVCDSESLDNLHNTFCMHMYGCELWNLSYGKVDKFRVAWRKVKRRLWRLPTKTHNTIVHNLNSDFNVLLEKRMIKFIHNSLHCNIICNQLLHTKLRSKNS